jgi:hypothetical protein
MAEDVIDAYQGHDARVAQRGGAQPLGLAVAAIQRVVAPEGAVARAQAPSAAFPRSGTRVPLLSRTNAARPTQANG